MNKFIVSLCFILTTFAYASVSKPSNQSCCNQLPARIHTKNCAMALIPAGSFMMGGDNDEARSDEFPKHKISLSAFWMDKTPVTNAQFAEFIKKSNYITTAEKPVDWEQLKLQLPPWTPKPRDEDLMPASLIFIKQNQPVPLNDPSIWWAWVHNTNWQHPHGPESSIEDLNHPVVHVSWDDALAYCNYYGKRLPTEAEWEYAARGGLENKLYPWGDEPINEGKQKANVWQGEFPYENKRVDSIYTTAVGTYPANNYGLYDMAGNVWEWVSDWYDHQYYSSSDNLVNPQGPQQSNDPSEPFAPKKVIRGGSFLCNANYCTGYRVSARMRTSTDTSMEHLGFRCVADAELETLSNLPHN